MRRRKLIIILSLTFTLSLYIVACGKQESLNPTDQTNQTDQSEEVYTTDQSEPETTETTETQADPTDQPDQSESEFIEETTTARTDYPDSNTSHQKAWDNFCENWNESDYGTTTKGKTQNDFPYYGDTGYDPNGTILQERTTDKGYKVMYDTETGRVYYTGMVLPTGQGWDDIESGGIIMNYANSKGYNNIYDVTYAEFQEVLGVYNGD